MPFLWAVRQDDGENPMDQRTDDPKEFLNHSRWHRFLLPSPAQR